MRERFHDMMKKSDNDYRHPVPQESYSRELDSRVQQSEMPYGYSDGEPPAGTNDFDTQGRVSRKQYHRKM